MRITSLGRTPRRSRCGLVECHEKALLLPTNLLRPGDKRCRRWEARCKRCLRVGRPHQIKMAIEKLTSDRAVRSRSHGQSTKHVVRPLFSKMRWYPQRPDATRSRIQVLGMDAFFSFSSANRGTQGQGRKNTGEQFPHAGMRPGAYCGAVRGVLTSITTSHHRERRSDPCELAIGLCVRGCGIVWVRARSLDLGFIFNCV